MSVCSRMMTGTAVLLAAASLCLGTTAFADEMDSAPIEVPPTPPPATPEPEPEPEKPRLRYIPPTSMPFLNETPFITTELRPIYMYNKIPSGYFRNNFGSGGEINIAAVQIRAKITEKLAFIVTKAGWADIDGDGTNPDTDGILNLAFGFKWSVVQNIEKNAAFAIGLRYEAPSGDLKNRDDSGAVADRDRIKHQDGGDGFINPFITGAWKPKDWLGVQASFGLNQAVDSDQTSFIHASLHTDLGPDDFFVYPVLELNVISKADEGGGSSRTRKDADGGFEGFDLFNYGNNEPGTVFTFAGGLRFPITECFQFRHRLRAAVRRPQGHHGLARHGRSSSSASRT